MKAKLVLYGKNMDMLRAQAGRSNKELLMEALDDLFTKRGAFLGTLCMDSVVATAQCVGHALGPESENRATEGSLPR
jgi:hypothetical protein